MAHTGVFATSDEILTRAGENYDTGVTEARINALCLQAESVINSISRKNWTDLWNAASLNVDVKYILSAAEACWVAIRIINYNAAGYSNSRESETMLDVLRDEWKEISELLANQATVTWIVGQ